MLVFYWCVLLKYNDYLICMLYNMYKILIISSKCFYEVVNSMFIKLICSIWL